MTSKNYYQASLLANIAFLLLPIISYLQARSVTDDLSTWLVTCLFTVLAMLIFENFYFRQGKHLHVSADSVIGGTEPEHRIVLVTVALPGLLSFFSVAAIVLGAEVSKFGWILVAISASIGHRLGVLWKFSQDGSSNHESKGPGSN